MEDEPAMPRDAGVYERIRRWAHGGSSRKVLQFSAVIGVLFCGIFVFLVYALTDLKPIHYDVLICGDPPSITFYKVQVDQCTRLRKIEFLEESEPTGKFEVLWTIYPGAAASAGASIGRLEYGHVPVGWVESGAARPISMQKNNKIVLHTTTGDFSIELDGREDWNSSGLCTRR